MTYDTDKIENGLIEEYQARFAHLRERPVALLEIGVARGGSLRFWADYFRAPGTRIVGVDITLPEAPLPGNVVLRRCDQMDAAGLSTIAGEHGPFDVIIDDASHQTAETQHCFDVLWPHVAVGGYYVVEDWAVGYWRKRPRYLAMIRPGPRYEGMVQVVTGIIERVPELSVEAFDVVLAPHKAMAFFRKGERGWTA
jgi:cephalosporin hydroxylase